MLVLSRKCNEKIILKVGEEEIEIVIVRIDPSKIRIGIEASDAVTIVRSELLENNN